MGREIKRVDLDFDWYEKTKDEKGHTATWKGYILDIDLVCFLCDGKGKNSKGKECPLCYGDGKVTPGVEPPWGDGYQVWQTVSEGSPVSPVFEKPPELARWMVKNDNSTTKGTSYNAWLKMIKEEGCVPSGMISSEKGFQSGMGLYEEKKVHKPKQQKRSGRDKEVCVCGHKRCYHYNGGCWAWDDEDRCKCKKFERCLSKQDKKGDK